MPSQPGPNMIARTGEEVAALTALDPDPSAQVFPFKPNPNAMARYRLLQAGKEVGWVYVAGADQFNCKETWQLYKAGVPAGGGVARAPYVWPSFEATNTTSKDVTLQLKFDASVGAVSKPEGLSPGTHYDELVSTVEKNS